MSTSTTTSPSAYNPDPFQTELSGLAGHSAARTNALRVLLDGEGDGTETDHEFDQRRYNQAFATTAKSLRDSCLTLRRMKALVDPTSSEGKTAVVGAGDGWAARHDQLAAVLEGLVHGETRQTMAGGSKLLATMPGSEGKSGAGTDESTSDLLDVLFWQLLQAGMEAV